MKNYVFSLCATTPVIFIGNAFPFKSSGVKCLPFLGPFPSPSFTWSLAIRGQRFLLLMFCVIETRVPVVLRRKPSQQQLLVCKGQTGSRALYFFLTFFVYWILAVNHQSSLHLNSACLPQEATPARDTLSIRQDKLPMSLSSHRCRMTHFASLKIVLLWSAKFHSLKGDRGDLGEPQLQGIGFLMSLSLRWLGVWACVNKYY